MAKRIPTVSFDALFHIGTLDAADKGSHFRSSYEGHGLSVSRDPEEWERIAKLGGLPWWELRRDGNVFLDAHRISKVLRSEIERWAIRSDYAVRERVWQVIYYDSELEAELAFLCTSRSAALEEQEALGDLDARIEPHTTLKGTPRFCEQTGLPVDLGQFDQLLVLWVEQETDLDGVWWEDDYGYLSAPRGVIVPSKLPHWQRQQLHPGE